MRLATPPGDPISAEGPPRLPSMASYDDYLPTAATAAAGPGWGRIRAGAGKVPPPPLTLEVGLFRREQRDLPAILSSPAAVTGMG